MADITKKVSTLIPANERSQVWVSSGQADDGTPIAEGDVFRVETSLGVPARSVLIKTEFPCNLQVRFNTRQRRYARHVESGLMSALNTESFYNDLGTEREFVDNTMTALIIGSSTEDTDLVLTSTIVRDIEITTWTTGTFTVAVSSSSSQVTV